MGLTLIDVKISDDMEKDLFQYLTSNFESAVVSRREGIEGKYQRWLDNYNAKPKEAVRTSPFYGASNFVPQLIRMHSDILSARILGLLVAPKPFWQPKSLRDGLIPRQTLEAIQTEMEFISNMKLHMFETLDTVTHRTVKTGTCVLKAPWVDNSFYVMSPGSVGMAGQERRVDSSGLDLTPVPFDDFFVYPFTAKNVRVAEVNFTRIRLTKMQVEYRRDNKLWNEDAVKYMIDNPGGSDSKEQSVTDKTNAQDVGVTLTADTTRPFTAVEAHLRYPLKPGQLFPIIVVFNPKCSDPSKGILRMYYNPDAMGNTGLVDTRIMPRDDCFYGYSIPEILEQAQEEQAQLHNARIDSNRIANVPTFKKRRYADVGDPASEWYPGKVFEVDDMADLDLFGAQRTYNSMLEEESHIMNLAERYTGINQAQQGVGAGSLDGKRGIYNSGGTFAMLAEGNRRLDVYIKRLRLPMNHLGQLIFHSYRQWSDDAQVRQAFNQVQTPNNSNLFFEIGASDASANKEIDRNNLLLMANTMSGYYRQIVEAAATVRVLPPGDPLREIMLVVLDGARDLSERLLYQFDIQDRKGLVPDVRAVLGGGIDPASPEGTEQGGMPGAPGPVSDPRMAGLASMLSQLPPGAVEMSGAGVGPGGLPPSAGPQ